jgi:hypothetical protein
MSHKAQCPPVRCRVADQTVHIRIDDARIPQRGQRYNREKTAGHGQSGDQNDTQTTAQRLGWQPTVSVTSIRHSRIAPELP